MYAVPWNRLISQTCQVKDQFRDSWWIISQEISPKPACTIKLNGSRVLAPSLQKGSAVCHHPWNGGARRCTACEGICDLPRLWPGPRTFASANRPGISNTGVLSFKVRRQMRPRQHSSSFVDACFLLACADCPLPVSQHLRQPQQFEKLAEDGSCFCMCANNEKGVVTASPKVFESLVFTLREMAAKLMVFSPLLLLITTEHKHKCQKQIQKGLNYDKCALNPCWQGSPRKSDGPLSEDA